MQSHEKVLGVAKGANSVEVRRAFMALAKVHHPDKSNDPDADAKFRRVHEAYEALMRTCPRAPVVVQASTEGAKPGVRNCTDCGRPSPAGFSGKGLAHGLWFCSQCHAQEEARNKEAEDWFSSWRRQLAESKKGGRRRRPRARRRPSS